MSGFRIAGAGAAAVGAVLAFAGCGGETERLRGELQGMHNELAQKRSEVGVLQLKVAELQRKLGEKEEQHAEEIAALKKALEGEEIGVHSKYGFPALSLPDKVFFAPGKADVTAKGQEALRTVASILQKDYPNRTILIEGHTDSDPIKHSPFRSNLDLSVTRAASVSLFLSKDAGLDPKMILTAGRGEHDPVAPNDTKENKGLNRRVEVVILPGFLSAGAEGAPKGETPPPEKPPAEAPPPAEGPLPDAPPPETKTPEGPPPTDAPPPVDMSPPPPEK